MKPSRKVLFPFAPSRLREGAAVIPLPGAIRGYAQFGAAHGRGMLTIAARIVGNDLAVRISSSVQIADEVLACLDAIVAFAPRQSESDLVVPFHRDQHRGWRGRDYGDAFEYTNCFAPSAEFYTSLDQLDHGCGIESVQLFMILNEDCEDRGGVELDRNDSTQLHWSFPNQAYRAPAAPPATRLHEGP